MIPAEHFLIWWTDQADADAIPDDMLINFPDYIRQEFASRKGRNGRGRLWVSPQLPWPHEGCSLDWNQEKIACRVIDSGSHAGIVIDANDIDQLAGLPGMVTRLDLSIIA